MKQSDLLQSLLSHTGSLQTAPGASQAELNDLRKAFAASLRSGQSLEQIGSSASNQLISESVRQDVEYLLAQDFEETHQRLVRRDLTAGAQSSVEWAAGMQPAQTFGPFLDELGQQHWFDLFIFHKPFRVLRGNQPLLVLPIGTKKTPNEAALSIPAGTVWIRANQLTSSVGADAWVGIRVKGGKVGFPQASTLTNATLTVSPAAIVKLQIDLDPPTLTGPATGSGSEATHTDAALPTDASFAFGPLGVENISTARASLNVYGNNLNLTRNAAGATYEPALRMVLIPMASSANSIKIDAVHSSLFKPTGKAQVEKAAWGLIVTISQPENLGTAAGAGALVLSLGPGITSTWLGLPKDEEPPALGKAFIVADPMSLTVVAQRASYFRGLQTLSLWQENAERHSTIDVSFPRPFLLSFSSSRNGTDSFLCEAQLLGHLDRPVTVSGQRLPVEMHGSLIFLQSATGTIVGVGGTAQLPSGFHPTAVALTNALLTITAPAGLYLNGTLGASLQVDKGSLVLTAGVYAVLPILPDPYVANFEPRGARDAPVGGVSMRATVKWSDPEQPEVDVTIDAPAAALAQLLPTANPRALDQLGRRLANSNYWLVDVSTNADQFGVVLSLPSAQAAVPDQSRVEIHDLSLQFPGNQLYTMFLPQFQWEAVYNIRNIRSGDVDGWLRTNVEGASPLGGDAPSDGGPSFVRTESARLVPLAPTPVAVEMVRAYTRDNGRSRVDFTLPFGIAAIAALQDERYTEQPGLKLLRVRFDGLQSAQQISLTTGKEHLRQIKGNQVIVLDGKLLAGRTVQRRNYIGSSRENTLGILRESFNNTFTTRVPIERIDLSGYGASIFSRWVPPIKQDVGITQVSFDAFNGRTSFERIQMVTALWPCIGRLVRTIVLERQGSGSVLRWDSGWLSTTPGLFTHEQFKVIHKGVVEGMYDIREIYDTDQILTLPPDEPGQDPAVVQAVYYDADIAFDPVAGQSIVETGQNSRGRVPAHRQLGFVQLVPPSTDPNHDFATDPARLLTQKQFDRLLQLVGPLGGPIDCKLRIGRSRQSMRVTSFATDRGGSETPDPKTSEFANAVFGSPVLPGSGAWSVVRVNTADRTVQPLDSNRGVPLIQKNGGAYRWADPIDLLKEANAKLDYGLLMAHDAQRLLVQRPKIEINSPNISSTKEPKLADPYSMLSSTGLFPKVDDVIKLPLSELTAGTLKLATNVLNLPAIPLPDKRLVDLSAWKDLADFSKASLKIDSLNNWKIHIKQAQQVLKLDVLGEITRLVHDFESSASDPSKFMETALQFPPLLDAVIDVLNMLKSLMPGGGGLGPFKFSASFSGTTFSVSAVADFQLATKNGDAVESGVGKIKGNLRVGSELSAELLKRDIRGAVFLEITGSYQQLIFPFIYGGGLLRFFIRADQDGKTTLEFDACTCGSIGGTIIPGLIDLEATVKYGYFLQVKTSVTPGIVLGMEGRANLLSGLVAFKFGVEGRIIIDPQPLLSPNDSDRDIRLYGRIRVAGTVTLAWAIEESKSFETDFETRVNWKLAFAAAMAGLLPVP